MIEKGKIDSIKAQLITEIEKSVQDPQKSQLITQIKKMSSTELENFLKQNNLIRDDSKCIFCSIVNGEIPTYKLIENDSSIATLEINPITKGHTIIIPKIHSKETPKEATNLAAEIAEHLKFLKPKSIEVIPSEMFGHSILNVLPTYNNETLNSPRSKAQESELAKLQKQIQDNIKTKQKSTKQEKSEKKKKPIEKKEMISEKNTWLPKRIP